MKLVAIPILPSISIFLGLILLEYIIYDSYLKNKKPINDKQYVFHEQRDLIELESIPSLVDLPSLDSFEPLTNQFTSQDNFSVLSASIPQYDNQPVATPLTQPIIPVLDAIPAVPKIPDSGLPQGWTIEQWNYYGAQWLESRTV